MQHKILHIAFEGNETQVPYYILEGVEEGPHVFISGGMHGDEVNGIEGVHRFLQYAKENDITSKLKGKITIIPLMNPTGFERMQRRVQEDEMDLNRSFGALRPSTFAESLAKTLTDELLSKCSLGIDLHDGGGGTVLLPHSRVLKNEEDGVTKSMGQLFGTKIIIEREGHPNMMAVALNRDHGVPVITVETGGAQQVFPEFVDQSLQGILNILMAYKMIDGEPRIPKEQYFLHNRFGIQAIEAGVVSLEIKLGDLVHVGDHIGKVYFPESQDEQELISPMCGILFAKWFPSQIPKGKIIYAVLETEGCHRKQRSLRNLKALPHFNLKQFDFSK